MWASLPVMDLFSLIISVLCNESSDKLPQLKESSPESHRPGPDERRESLILLCRETLYISRCPRMKLTRAFERAAVMLAWLLSIVAAYGWCTGILGGGVSPPSVALSLRWHALLPAAFSPNNSSFLADLVAFFFVWGIAFCLNQFWALGIVFTLEAGYWTRKSVSWSVINIQWINSFHDKRNIL